MEEENISGKTRVYSMGGAADGVACVRRNKPTVWGKGVSLIALSIVTVFLFLFIFGGGATSYAASNGAVKTSVAEVKSKTDATLKAEKDLEKLTANEKTIKEQISAETINRSKLLAQKRAEIKGVRLARDEVIKKNMANVRDKKTKQANLIKELKIQLANARKNKNQYAIAAAQITINLAQLRLSELNADLKILTGRLSQSYKDYKAVYDKLTDLDATTKKILDKNIDTEKKIKEQKAEFKIIKAEYNQLIKSKDFASAEKKMNTLVSIQTAINSNYEKILSVKKTFKSEYYKAIVNYVI